MLEYLVRRICYMVITLILVSIIGFLLIALPPGTYLDVKIAELRSMGTNTASVQIEQLEKKYHLDQAIYVQYWNWITGFVRGDFGRSFLYNRPVSELIGDRLLNTVLISVSTIIFTWIVALPIGIYSATHKYSLTDNIFTVIGFLGLSIPNFLLALVFMIIGATYFNQPIGGLFSMTFRDAPWSFARFIDLLKHLWIPIIVVGTSGTASLIRMMRSNLLDILNEQYVQTARAKGLKEWIVIYKHAVRNAVHPLIMTLGMSLPAIISGSTVVSLVLSLPTTGPLYFKALQNQDMYLAGTFLIFLSVMLIVGNLLADLLLVWVDPRIKY